MGRSCATEASYRILVDPLELLNQSVQCEEQGRLDDAIAGYVRLLRIFPRQGKLYRRLLDIHLHRREIDAAWCAASVLVVLDELDDTMRDFYEDYVPRRLPVRRAPLDATAWSLLRHPDEDDRLSIALGAMVDTLAPPPESRGFDATVLGWAADSLGAGASGVPRGPTPLDPHANLDTVRDMFMLRERLFFAGREATSFVRPHYALARSSVWKVKEALGASAPGDVMAWHRAIRLTRVRAGLLVCGEPVVAHRILVGEGAPEEELAELAAFAVSPEHHRLRGWLGGAVGMGADVPALAPVGAPAGAVEPRIRVAAGVAADELRALLRRAEPGMPSASDLRLYFESRKVRSLTCAGLDLSHPPWATIVRGGTAVFIEIDSDAPERLVGVQLAAERSETIVELTFVGAVLGDLVEAIRPFETRIPIHAPSPPREVLSVTVAVGRRPVSLVAEHRSGVLERVLVTFR